MNDLLRILVTYLDTKTDLIAGTSLFYNEMPDGTTRCALVQEFPNSIAVPAQIDAEVHKLKLVVREKNHTAALSLAQLCWRWLLTDDSAYDIDKRIDATGFITLDGVPVKIQLYGNPVWEKTDSQGRKYYSFYFTAITKR